MPKIIHCIQDLSSGGGRTVAINYFPEYVGEYETIVLCCPDASMRTWMEQKGLRVHDVIPRRPRHAIFFIPKLIRFFLKEKPDLLVVHGQWAGFCASLAARIAGVRSIIYVTHMPSFYSDFNFVSIIRNRIGEAVTCRLASRVVALTQASRYQYLMRHLLSEEKLIHIPNGINLTRIQPATDNASLRRQLGLPENRPVVISVGRLDHAQKRLDWLVNAWQQVEAAIPDAYLGIVGGGEDLEPLQKLSRKMKMRNVHFLGGQPEGWRYFAAADVAVVTSMYEGGNPLSMLEAFASGCPIIGTAADGVLESIEASQAGICVPVAKPDNLAAALIGLLQDPDKRQCMGQNGRRYVEQFHDLNISLSRHKELARTLLALT